MLIATCIIIIINAVTLVPPSITTCPGQTVMFHMVFLLDGVSLLLI